MCRICYNNSVPYPVKSFIFSYDPTTTALCHLARHGFDHKGDFIQGTKRKNMDIEKQLKAQ